MSDIHRYEAVSRARQAVAEAEALLHRTLNDALAALYDAGLSRKEAARQLGIHTRRIDKNGTYVRSVGETRRLFNQAFSVTDYAEVDALRDVLERFATVR